MLSLLIAGGSFLGATTQTTQVTQVDTYNHTLRGERILAKEVVCRSRWGTPMLPDGKGGYSLIAPINPEFIERSLFQPPLSSGPAFRPAGANATTTLTLSAQ
jgi:hypothetical protein